MAKEETRWIGNLRGSRIGSLFLTQHGDEEAFLVIGFHGGPDVRLTVTKGEEKDAVELRHVTTREIYGRAQLLTGSEQAISGVWQFVSGAEGVFDLYAAEAQKPRDPVTTHVSDQLRNRSTPLGPVTLHRSDLNRLIAEMESLVPSPNITSIRALEAGQFVIEPAERYLARQDFVDVVRTMTISTAEVSEANLRKIIFVHLNDDGSSQIEVTSPDELWTEAASSRISAFLSQFTSKFIGALRKHGLNINSFIILSIIIWMPDRPLGERVVGIFVGFLIILGIAKSHSLLPYNRVYLDPERQKRPFAKELPAAVLAVLAGGFTAALSSATQIFEYGGKLVQALRDAVGF